MNLLVIDASASVRETLRIVLGHEHAVTVAASVDGCPSGTVPDVVVLGLPAAGSDRAAVTRALTGSLAGIPLLFLHASRDVELATFVRTETPVEFLAKPFDAYAIRDKVRRLLAADAARRPASAVQRGDAHWLGAPWISVTAAEIARIVVASGLDVMFVRGEPGTGLADVARALHETTRADTLVVLDARRVIGGGVVAALPSAPSSSATLYVEHVDCASPEVLAELAGVIRDVRDAGRRLRVIVSAEGDLVELAAGGAFPTDLAYALSAVPIVLTPLRDRPDDLPKLVESLTRTWAERLGLGTVTYRPATLERLQQYLWFGNVAELEAVLVRTLVLHRPAVVEPEHVVFLAEDTARAVQREGVPEPDAAAVAAPPPGGSGVATLDLEVLVGELAHELRNPMVTIKTVAQHLDGILDDPVARARFSTLMAEAVGRMDDVVETLLDFARFRTPAVGSVDLAGLVARALDEQREELGRRQVQVERNGAGMGRIAADEAQVAFAFRCLYRGLLPNVVARSTMHVDGAGPGVVELRVRSEPSVTARLAAWVAPLAKDTEETPPLSWALARALLARNGAALSVQKGQDQTMVVRVEWARPEGGVVERMEG